ncbi:copper amine oxidase N-terminal domain-containing protein [Paenibacillus sp. GCM10012307]|uniref:Copper amine oxidase N-terminal domain-containing protein n=1 Tax=Paenibacillus roseus TaxID=2798579 RepID=A0A934J9P9_9BACL|nr:copper amine oxidase N-terminal domain-containing protein [Paenibacillus roseus]MBJ6363022.1 copper amine oxidase N-terminal domain-containing protein [Paenibacillus roseus]
MMKKLMAVMVAGAILFPGIAVPMVDAAVLIAGNTGKQGVTTFKTDVSLEVLYDARRIKFDIPPKMVQGSVLVPIRFVAENIGGKLDVNGKEITVTKGDKVLKLSMDSNKAFFNGKAVTLAQPAIVDRGRTLVPLRAVSEGLGVDVEWDQLNQYVWIGSKDVPKIEDVITPVDAKPYLKYYPEDAPILTIFGAGGKKKTTMRLVNTDDFPLVMGNNIIVYRLDKSSGSDGKDFIRFSSSTKGNMGNGLLLMQSNSFRFQRPYTTEFGTKIPTLDYIPIDYYGDKETTWLKNIDYIGINLGSDSLIAIKNEWR